MRPTTSNASRRLFLSCPQRIPPSIVPLRHALLVLARRSNGATADEQALNQSAVLLDSLMGSSSSLDLRTSSLPDILSSGKRARAEHTVSRTLLYIHALARAPPLPILRHALITASPAVKCISQKLSGTNIVRPTTLTEKQCIKVGINAVLAARKLRSGKRGGGSLSDSCCSNSTQLLLFHQRSRPKSSSDRA